MMDQGMSMADVLALKGDGDGFGGGESWIFLLFILLAFGNGGFGMGGNNGALQNALTRADLNEGFAFNNIDRQLQGLANGICDSTYALNTAISGVGAQMSSCCCEINRNIDTVRYEGAKNTCDIINGANLNTRDIITNQTANTQRIVDLINANENQNLRDKNQEYALQLSQQAQSASLLAQLRPCPIPAYPSCNPWATGAFTGCGC